MGTVYLAAGAAAALSLTRAGVGEAIAGSAAYLAAASLAFGVQVPVTWRDYDVPRERKRVRWPVLAVTVGIGLALDTAVVVAVRDFLTFTVIYGLGVTAGVSANYVLCDFFVLRPRRADRSTVSARRRPKKRRRVPMAAKFALRGVRWRQAGQR